MNTFAELCSDRRSVRSYTARPVEPEKIEYLLRCAQSAPSAVNLQPWRFFVVRNEPYKQRLRDCYAREWFAQAPLYIVVCADRTRSWKRHIDGKDHADIDAAIAAEHLCLAATEQGLGSCWVCNFDPERCREALDLPDRTDPIVILTLGYPNDTPTEKQRRPLLETVVER